MQEPDSDFSIIDAAGVSVVSQVCGVAPESKASKGSDNVCFDPKVVSCDPRDGISKRFRTRPRTLHFLKRNAESIRDQSVVRAGLGPTLWEVVAD